MACSHRQLDEQLDEDNWQMICDAFESPVVRAYCALKDLDLGPELSGNGA
jgi:hypothetical protein